MMEADDENYTKPCLNLDEDNSKTAVNSTILNYYKKFGRKRDLEQYFSLSTAHTEVRDPSGLFWRRMKANYDSSDSGEKKSESSTEVCRISIKCSVPDPSTSSQEEQPKNSKIEAGSPPIITDDIPDESRHSDMETDKFDLNLSQKSNEPGDTSTNKPLSPTSSVTSQRKLEWDSLADVGYANETDRKNSASNLSTLEKLALKQQYSNSDNRILDAAIGLPTAQSTPVDEVKEVKQKTKTSKSHFTKNTKLYKKDVLKVNVPKDNVESLNVNLTRHISFNVDRQGVVTDNLSDDVLEKVESRFTPELKIDKEVQTSLIKKKQVKDEAVNVSASCSGTFYSQGMPTVLKLNTAKRHVRDRKKSLRKTKKRVKKLYTKKTLNLSCQEKSGEQVSDAESFEYMPGHIYNQNRHNRESQRSFVGNKSSLESSGHITSGSSKSTTKSFSKDLEEGVDKLNKIIKQHHDNTKLKEQLIKEVVLKLLKSKYNDDDTPTEFLSGLSFNSKNLGLGQGDVKYSTTTSTSDANNSENLGRHVRPKKSILRTGKFDSSALASTTQSVPNLHMASTSDRPLIGSSFKVSTPSFSDTDGSSKNRNSTDGEITSSEKLYQKYLEALKKEETHRKILLDKEKLLKRKLASSEMTINNQPRSQLHVNKVTELLNDLTRSSYGDGSGDASKVGAISSSQISNKYDFIRKHRNHSVFTLSSQNSSKKYNKEEDDKQFNAAKNLSERNEPDRKLLPNTSKKKAHVCNCPFHKHSLDVADSAVQVNVDYNNDISKQIATHQLRNENVRNVTVEGSSQSLTDDIKYVCFCSESCSRVHDMPGNFLIYKCSRIPDNKFSNNKSEKQESTQACNISDRKHCDRQTVVPKPHANVTTWNKQSKSSQTDLNLAFKLSQRKSDDIGSSSSSHDGLSQAPITNYNNQDKDILIQTDITINPILSDPSISDVKYVNNDTVCPQEHDIEENKNINYDTFNVHMQLNFPPNTSRQLISTDVCVNENVANKPESKEIPIQVENECFIDLAKDKYVIPLAGHMALTVDIDENKNPFFSDEVKHTVNQGMITDKICITEKGTSLYNECTKAVQSVLNRKFSSHSDTAITDQKTKMKMFSQNKGKSLNDSYEYQKQRDQKAHSPRRENIGETNKYHGDVRIGSTGVTQNKHLLGSHPKEPLKLPYDNKKYSTYPTKVTTFVNKKQLFRANTDSAAVSSAKENIKFDSGKLKCHCGKPSCSCNKKLNINQTDICNQNMQDKKQSTNGRNVCNCIEKCGKDYCDCRKMEYSDNYENFSTEKKSRHLGKVDVCYCINNCGIQNCDCSKKDYLAMNDDIKQNEPERDGNICDCIEGCGKSNCGCRKKHIEQNKYLGPKDEDNTKEDNNACECLDKCGEPNCLCSTNVNHQKYAKTSDRNVCDCIEGCGKYDCSCSKRRYTEQNNYLGTNCEDNDKGDANASECIDKCGEPNCVCSKNVNCQKYEKTSGKDHKSAVNVASISHQQGYPKIGIVNGQEQTVRHIAVSNKAATCAVETKEQSPKETLQKKCIDSDKSAKSSDNTSSTTSDPIIELIKDITRRYSKNEVEKSKRKKCFKDIMTVLNYLVDTEDATELDIKAVTTDSTSTCECINNCGQSTCKSNKPLKKELIDRGIQHESSKYTNTESSDLPCSSDKAGTSPDSTAYKILSRIKKECEKYQQKRCRSTAKKEKWCDMSSSTSVICDKCNKSQYCTCKVAHRCKKHKVNLNNEKVKKKCVAYNLIIQTSDSIVGEETVLNTKHQPLRNIIVKVPSKRRMDTGNLSKKECSPRSPNKVCCSVATSPHRPAQSQRSQISPNDTDLSSADDPHKRERAFTVREYLEKNKPDFVERCLNRQNCLKMISETRANERTAHRKLLSLQLQRDAALNRVSITQLQRLARELGIDSSNKIVPPKFISEKDMKKHSEKIYKTLPEVTQKKEELRKERIKKTNLIMASLFNKNLQKKTLKGTVNLSNYSNVIKI